MIDYLKNKYTAYKNRGFTLIELIVVMAIIAVLVLLAAPKFIEQTDTAQDSNIQNDVKVAEMKVSEALVDGVDVWESWTDDGVTDVTSDTLKTFIREDGTGTTLYARGGPIYDKDTIEYGRYGVLPGTFIEQEIRSRLEGTFYANKNGTVYYESGVVRQSEADKKEPSELGQTTEPEKEPEYSDEEIEGLIAEGYIPIATAEELNNVRDAGGLDKKYVQVANIDLSEYSEEGWTPIGDNLSRFTGTYDGGNYVIRGLETKGENYQGLFGRTERATISNVGLIDNKVTGTRYVGGLVGYASTSTKISNSYAKGEVTGTGQYVGGLVGTVYSSTIENSYATGPVKGTEDVGGLVGYASTSTKISNSYATGEVTGEEDAGGLVGRVNNDTEISNSYATGSVTGDAYVGGLVGSAQGSHLRITVISNSYATGPVTGTGYVGGLAGQSSESTTISYSYATGEVTGGLRVGGLVGWFYNSTIINSYSSGSISITGTGNQVGGLVGAVSSGKVINSYATGSVEGSGNIVGGLVGWVFNKNTISNSYWDIETTRQSTSAGGTGMSTDEMKKEDTYLDWDFVNVWKIDEGQDYPKLR